MMQIASACYENGDQLKLT